MLGFPRMISETLEKHSLRYQRLKVVSISVKWGALDDPLPTRLTPALSTAR